MNLSQGRDILLPALWQMCGDASRQRGSTVMQADLQINFVDDTIELCVKHRLFGRHELEDGSFKGKFAPRVGAALGLKDPEPAKTIRVERRQLRWRGEQAARRVPRPVRAPARRRFA